MSKSLAESAFSPVGPHVVWRVLRAELATHAGRPYVVDIGGGTGGFAVELAVAGARVLVVDPSPDALAALDRRATERGVANLVTGAQGDALQVASLVAGEHADMVLCHSVLEFVDDPVATVRDIAGILRPLGALSLVTANHPGSVVGLVAAGQLAQARAVLGNPAKSGFNAAALSEMVAAAGLLVEQVHGVRIFSELSGQHEQRLPDPTAAKELDELELACAAVSPYRDIAAQLHVLARRDGR